LTRRPPGRRRWESLRDLRVPLSSAEHSGLYLTSVWILRWDAADFSVDRKHSALFPHTHTHTHDQQSAILNLRLADWRHFVCSSEWRPVSGLCASVSFHTITACLCTNSCIKKKYLNCEKLFSASSVWLNPDRHWRRLGVCVCVCLRAHTNSRNEFWGLFPTVKVTKWSNPKMKTKLTCLECAVNELASHNALHQVSGEAAPICKSQPWKPIGKMDIFFLAAMYFYTFL